MNASDLRARITRSLRQQGFRICGRRISPPHELSKDRIRRLHETAVQHKIAVAGPRLAGREDALLEHIASGNEVAPEKVRPRLIEVLPDSQNELLFRYACLHWSIPVSSGYGRRLRVLVVDEQNGKLIGLLGLGDPVFAIAARDEWVGWDRAMRRERLRHVMDAFVLGAVPPYSFLLGGKLVAMLAASDEVRLLFKKKYCSHRSVIAEKSFDGRLALITTSSALGRSSIYNRLKFGGRVLYHHVGFTRGSGEFHFSNGLYAAIAAYAAKHCQATAKQEAWGTGFRNRREVIRKCLAKLGLPADWVYHGVQREVFAVPLAENTLAFLRGQHVRLRWFSQPADDLFSWFWERWLLRRAARDTRFARFRRSDYRLWH